MAKINSAPLYRNERASFESSWFWYHLGAALGLVGGFLATIIGLILTAMTRLAGSEIAASVTGQLGVWMIIATIPAMMFGAHCLDKIEAASKARRIAYCQEHGLNDKHCAGLWK